MEFVVRNGVKQGCVLTPMLFSVLLLSILRLGDLFNIRWLSAKTKTKPVSVCELQYADDNAIVEQRSHRDQLRATSKLRQTNHSTVDSREGSLAFVCFICHVQTEDGLQNSLDAFHHAYKDLGLRIDVKKTQVLCQSHPGISNNFITSPHITDDRQALCTVEAFSCLLAKLTSTLRSLEDCKLLIHLLRGLISHI